MPMDLEIESPLEAVRQCHEAVAQEEGLPTSSGWLKARGVDGGSSASRLPAQATSGRKPTSAPGGTTGTQLSVVEARFANELQRVRREGDRAREAALARFEERLAAAEAPQPRMERRLSELCGACERLSARVEVVEARLLEWRRQFEERFQTQKSEMEGRLQKSCFSSTCAVKTTEEALLHHSSRIEKLEAGLPRKQTMPLQRESQDALHSGLAHIHSKLEQSEQATTALHERHSAMEEKFERQIAELLESNRSLDNGSVQRRLSDPTLDVHSGAEILSKQVMLQGSLLHERMKVVHKNLKSVGLQRSMTAPVKGKQAAPEITSTSMQRILRNTQRVCQVLHDTVWSDAEPAEAACVNVQAPQRAKQGELLQDGQRSREIATEDLNGILGIIEGSEPIQTGPEDGDLGERLQNLLRVLTELVPKVSAQEHRLNDIEPRLQETEDAREQLAQIVLASQSWIREQLDRLGEEHERLSKHVELPLSDPTQDLAG